MDYKRFSTLLKQFIKVECILNKTYLESNDLFLLLEQGTKRVFVKYTNYFGVILYLKKGIVVFTFFTS